MSSQTSAANEATNQAQIRGLIDDWVKAVRAKDIKSVLSHYAPDIVSFEIVPPLQHTGIDNYRKIWDEWFSVTQGPIGYEISELSITASDDVAFSHSLNRITETKTNGEKSDTWLRATDCYRKVDGRWVVTHEHFSVPFFMGSGKAMLDLKP